MKNKALPKSKPKAEEKADKEPKVVEARAEAERILDGMDPQEAYLKYGKF